MMFAVAIDKAVVPCVTLPSVCGKRSKRRPAMPGEGVSNMLLEGGAAMLLENNGVIIAESRVRQLNIQ